MMQDPIDQLFESGEQLRKIAKLNKTSVADHEYATAKLGTLTKIIVNKDKRSEERASKIIGNFTPLLREYLREATLLKRQQRRAITPNKEESNR